MSDGPLTHPKVIGEDEVKPLTTKEKEEAKTAKELSSKSSQEPTMAVKVASPFTVYFSGPAFSISGINATGPFDILPKHHNFISLLRSCTLVIRATTGEEQKIDIGGGLIHVKADKVSVFLDI